MPVHFYEFLDAKSHKFWEATLEGKSLSLRYGKWRSDGTTKKKSFDSAEKAQAELAKASAAKEKSGYLLSDPHFSLAIRQDLARAKKEKLTEFSLYTHHPEALAMVCELTQLEKLTISTNEPTTLPDALGNLVNLTGLYVDSCNLTRLPESLGKLKKLERLYCYLNKITALPESIGECTRLQDITAWSNELSEVPASIGNLKALTELDLHANQIRTLPSEIGELTALEELGLHRNELEALPPEIGKLKKLTKLEIQANPIAALPAEIGDLSSLEQLIFGKTRIAELPESIGQIKALIELSTSGSYDSIPLATLPESLAGHPNLTTLKLKYCSFSSVPELLKTLPNLESVTFYGNPLTDVPEEIRDDKDKIFAHLGWTQAGETVIESDRLSLPSAKELKKLVKQAEPRLKTFKREARLSRKEASDSIVDYVSGKTDEVPKVRAEDARHSGNIRELFGPYAEWSIIEERALAVCATRWRFKTNTYYSGFFDGFCTWLRNAVAEDDQANMFAEIAARLVEYGLGLDEVMLAVLDNARGSLFVDGRVTSVGHFFAEQCKDNGEAIVGWAIEEHAKGPLTEVLLRNGDVGPHMSRLLECRKYDDMVHPPLPVIRALVRFDAGAHEQVLHDAVAQSSPDCIPCLLELTQMLVDNYPEKQAASGMAKSEKLLEMISEKRNSKESGFFRISQDLYGNDVSKFIDWIFRSFGKEAKTIVYNYVENTKALDLDVIEVAARYLGQDGLPLVAEALNMTLGKGLGKHYQRVFQILRNLNFSEHYPKVWELASCEFEDVQNAASRALAFHPDDSIGKASELLASKSKLERMGAVKVLAAVGSKESLSRFGDLIDSEKNDDIRDLMVAALFAKPKEIALTEAKRRIAAAESRGKLKKWPKKWLEKTTLPALTWQGGAKLSDEELRFFLYRQVRFDDYGLDPEVRDLVPLLDEKEAALFATALFEAALKNGGLSAKNRPLLALAATLADASMAAPLREHGLERNENAVRMLGLQKNHAAAAALDAIRRCYQVKYPNVRVAAEEGFESVAERMELSVDELRDGLVPTLGFKHLVREFAVGDDVYTARINASRKLEFVAPGGKVVKSVPKAAGAEAKKEFKELSKELTANFREYKAIIDNWLVTDRRWKSEDWGTLFMQNALMNAAAQGLVWSLFHNEELVGHFVVNADKTLETLDGQKLSLLGPHWVTDFQAMLGMVMPKPFKDRKKEVEIRIGLTHPIRLEEEERGAWAALLQGRDAKACIQQLDRVVSRPDEVEARANISYRFEGRSVGGDAFKSRASRMGWRRGSVIDSGAVSAYYKHFAADDIDVFLTVDNLGVGPSDGAAELGRLFFVPHGSVVTGSYTYDEPRDEADERLIALAEVSPLVFSEAVGNARDIAGGEEEE